MGEGHVEEGMAHIMCGCGGSFLGQWFWVLISQLGSTLGMDGLKHSSQKHWERVLDSELFGQHWIHKHCAAFWDFDSV